MAHCPVLVAIDMQEAFDLPGRPRRWNADLDSKGLALLAAWRQHGLPVIHVRNESYEPASYFHAAHRGFAFRPGFEPARGEALITKSVNSSFIGTDLDLRLRRLGADEVVIFGMRTDMCVSSTARTGANIGWRMVVVDDACDCCDMNDPLDGTPIRAELSHRVHIATLFGEFAEIRQTSNLLADRLAS